MRDRDQAHRAEPAGVVVTVLAEATTVQDALDLVRRCRGFAEEAHQAGLQVEVRGDLSITVRPRARTPEEPAWDPRRPSSDA